MPSPQIPPATATTPQPRTTWSEVFLLGLLVFAGNFLFARLFGVYDDDFAFTVPPFAWTWSDAWAHIHSALTTWPQGRPVSFALTHLLSYLSAQSSSLGLGYAIGFLIVLGNAVLLHRLARRFLPGPAALLAAAVLVLYPLETSKAILMHRVFMQLNLTFLLIALLCFARDRRWVAYLVSPLCFLCYEPVYLVFLAAPLLVDSPRLVSWRRLLVHGALCIGTLALLLFLRQRLGDPRIGETFGAPLEVVQRIAQALWIGPKTAITALVARPLEALRATDALVWVVVLFCAGAFVRVADRRPAAPPAAAHPLWIAAVGAIGLLLGYAVCFRIDYWPPIMTIGRVSGYHAAGSVGAALLVGGLFAWLLTLRPGFQRWLVAGAALYCGLLVSFGIEVQRVDFVRHSEQQARFWGEIVEVSGELQPDTVILVDISGNDPSRPFTPGMPLWWVVNFAPTFLEHIVEWPAEWSSPANEPKPARSKRPRVYGFQAGFETITEDDSVTIKTPAWLGPSAWPKVRDGGFIYFRFSGGHMVRVTEPVHIGGRELTPLGPPAVPPQRLKTKRLYQILFTKKTDWQTIKDARNYPR